MLMNWMKEHVVDWVRYSMASVLVIFVTVLGACGPALASPLRTQQPIVAYNIDFGMDLAAAEQTIEYYGEEIRELVENALMNNENHPESKDTAKNSFQRESALNNLLPEKRSSAFSKEELTNLKKMNHPKDMLK